MSFASVLLMVLVVMLCTAFPAWPHSQGWGYWPSAGVGVIVLVMLVLLAMGRL